MEKFQNIQMLEAFLFYREIALQYLTTSQSISFQKVDKNHIIEMSAMPSMLMYDELSVRRLQLAISIEREVNESPLIPQELTKLLIKAKIALYETNQEKTQKV